MSLSHDAVRALVTRPPAKPGQPPDASFQPILQLIDIKPVQPAGAANAGAVPDRYHVMLSDGQHFVLGMLTSQLVHLVNDGTLKVHQLLQVQEYMHNTVQSRHLIILLKLQVLNGPFGNVAERIGSPSDIGLVVPAENKPAAAAAPQPLYNSTNNETAAAAAAASNQPPTVASSNSMQISPPSNPYGRPVSAPGAGAWQPGQGGQAPMPTRTTLLDLPTSLLANVLSYAGLPEGMEGVFPARGHPTADDWVADNRFSSNSDLIHVYSDLGRIQREQASTENILLQELGGVNGLVSFFESVVCLALEQTNLECEPGCQCKQFTLRGDFLAVLAELLQQNMVKILRQAHYLSIVYCTESSYSDSTAKCYPALDSNYLGYILAQFYPRIPECKDANDTLRLDVPELTRARVVWKLVQRAGVVNVHDESTLEHVWRLLVVLSRRILWEARERTKFGDDLRWELNGYPEGDPKRRLAPFQSIRDIPPFSMRRCSACNQVWSMVTPVPTQIEDIAAALELPCRKVYGDEWYVHVPDGVDEDEVIAEDIALAEAAYEFTDGGQEMVTVEVPVLEGFSAQQMSDLVRELLANFDPTSSLEDTDESDGRVGDDDESIYQRDQERLFECLMDEDSDADSMVGEDESEE